LENEKDTQEADNGEDQSDPVERFLVRKEVSRLDKVDADRIEAVKSGDDAQWQVLVAEMQEGTSDAGADHSHHDDPRHCLRPLLRPGLAMWADLLALVR
jgi:hypothetical protein